MLNFNSQRVDITNLTLYEPGLPLSWENLEKSGKQKLMSEKSGINQKVSKGQGICLVRENCLCNKELDTHNHDLFNVFDSTTICDYWHP
jgi:hypothetical protein